MGNLLTDDQGRPIPQYQKADGSFEAVRGSGNHMDVRSDDGQIVVLGATTDAAGANTILGKLKQLVAGIPVALTAAGNLKAAIVEALPSGSNVIGKMDVNSALPAGSNIIGKVDLNNVPTLTVQDACLNVTL